MKLEVYPLGSWRYEIKDPSTGKYGLAVLENDRWEVSPNMAAHEAAILKRIKELENPTPVEAAPIEEPVAEPKKEKKNGKKSKK